MDVTIENLNEHLENTYLEFLERYREIANDFINTHDKQNARLDLMEEMSELNLEISKNLHAMWTIEGLEIK